MRDEAGGERIVSSRSASVAPSETGEDPRDEGSAEDDDDADDDDDGDDDAVEGSEEWGMARESR